jgi:glycerol-3-phosphate dehydrogenase
MIYFEADDGRICLVFDYLGRALVGSTDIPATDPDDVRCEADEIAYFLGSLRGLFPGLTFAETQIVASYSGIRPLPASDGTAPGLISRDHSAPVAEPEGERPFAIVSLVGGKWTTFRGFAEEVADALLSRLGRARRVSTRELAIGGGHDFPRTDAARSAWIARIAGETGLAADRVAALLDRYGTTAERIAGAEAASDAGWLQDATDVSLAEIAWIARHEAVVHLADIVLRRTTLALTGRLSARDLARIADLAGEMLGWSADRRTAEIETVTETLRARHRIDLGARAPAA